MRKKQQPEIPIQLAYRPMMGGILAKCTVQARFTETQIVVEKPAGEIEHLSQLSTVRHHASKGDPQRFRRDTGREIGGSGWHIPKEVLERLKGKVLIALEYRTKEASASCFALARLTVTQAIVEDPAATVSNLQDRPLVSHTPSMQVPHRYSRETGKELNGSSWYIPPAELRRLNKPPKLSGKSEK